MVQSVQCDQLNALDYFKIRLDNKGRIIFVDDAYLEFTGFDIADLILEPFHKLMFLGDNVFFRIFTKNVLDGESRYFIALMRKNNGRCFWALLKSTKYEHSGGTYRYLIEIKMLPIASVEKIKNIADSVLKIEEEVGIDYAEKYFDGFLEDKGINFTDFVYQLLETGPKQLEKYFKLKK